MLLLSFELKSENVLLSILENLTSISPTIHPMSFKNFSIAKTKHSEFDVPSHMTI